MNNLRTRASSTAVDFALKNNAYSVLSAGLKDLDLAIETDTGLLSYKNDSTYCRAAPRSTMTNNYIPKCKTDTTGELENSAAAQTANEFVVNGAEADLNFRVGTSGGSYGIYHDAGLNRTGFGEGTPAYRISITDANPVISLKDSDTGAIALLNAASSAGSLAIDADAFDTVASSKLTLGVDGTVAMTIDDSQNVGIGTTSPAAKLDVESATGVLLKLGPTAGGTYNSHVAVDYDDQYAGIAFKYGELYGAKIRHNAANGEVLFDGAIGNNVFRFRDLNTATYMSLVNGSIGLGATSPLGVMQIVKSLGTNPSTGIRLNVGNNTAESGTFTRDSTANPPIILADAGTLTDDGILNIIVEETVNTGDESPGFKYMGFICITAVASFLDECLGVVRRTAVIFASVTGTENGYETLIDTGASYGDFALNTPTDGKLCCNNTNSANLKIENKLGATCHLSYFAQLSKMVYDDLS